MGSSGSRCPYDDSLLAPVLADPYIGQTLAGRYEILEIIGTGGWSKVYKAKHVALDRIVAVKILNSHMISNVEKVKRFEQEAKSISLLAHPNIISIHDYGLVPQPFIVMDFIEGETIDEIIRQGPLPFATAVPIFSQICDALQFAHDHHLIHRDLKPSNVMLTTSSNQTQVKVLDFGLAKFFSDGSHSMSSLTKSGDTTGSPPYMSPEQCLGKSIDTRSDIYAMGCLIYETISGEKPFQGTNAIELMHKHIAELPPALLMNHPDLEVPASLQDVIMTTLAKDPEDRYKTMTELKSDLQSVASTGIPSSLILRRKRKKIELAMRLAAIATGVLLLLAAIFLWYQQGRKETEPASSSTRAYETEDGTVAEAHAYIRQGRYRIGLLIISRAFSSNPDNVAAYVVQAEGLIRIGQAKSAVSDCDKALSIDPKYTPAYSIRAWAHLSNGSYSQALADCDQAIKLDPNDVLAYEVRAEANHRTGKEEEALHDCNKAMLLAPKRGEPYLIRAAIFNKLGNWQESINNSSQALQLSLSPDLQAKAYDERANAYEKLGKPDSAKADRQAAEQARTVFARMLTQG